MKYKSWPKRDPVKNYFQLPNEIFLLGLSPGALAVYSYLLCCENRSTYQCWPSYKTIGKAVRMSANTVRKYVCELEDRQLISTESTTVTTKTGLKRNGNLLYTIRPIQLALDQFYEQQLARMDVATERQRVAKALALRCDKYGSRDELVRRAREEMKALIQEMRTSIGSHPEVESLMMTLVTQLGEVKGKKKYSYLPKAVKKTVDEIVDLMEQLPVVNECYQTWWELQCQIEDFYSERERRRPPLSQQKEFRSINNAVIQEAENIRMGKVTFEDEKMEEPTDFSDLSYDCWALWMVTQDDTAPMADRDEAAAQLIDKAKNGGRYAQYLIGKLYQGGPVLIPDSVEAWYWFDQSARQGVVAAQYELGMLLLTNDSEVRDLKSGIQWLEYAVRHGSDCASYRLGKEFLKGEIVERDITKAVEYLTQSAEAGNQYAQYALGKLYLDSQDREQAHYWFTRSAAQGNEYAQFFLERRDNLKPTSIMLSITRLLYYMSRIFQEQMPVPTVPGGIRIDRKRLVQLREKKIAMGHKPDDHEEQVPSQTMAMG